VGALGGRDGGRPVTGGARGSARAAARRAPQVLRRSCQSGRGEFPAGACARPAELAAVALPASVRNLPRDYAPPGARRAPRAFKDVRETSHRTRRTKCPTPADR